MATTLQSYFGHWGGLVLGLICCPLAGLAQTVPSEAALLLDAQIENAEAARLGEHLYLSPQQPPSSERPQTGQVTIPRLAASLRAMHWLGRDADDSLSLKIEPAHWTVSWKSRPADSNVIVLRFDSSPKLMHELQPKRASGDGSIFLKACEAITVGEKIRYEPQSFKNTVGYWVGKQDYAEWKFQPAQAGEYNVAILQGCGAGQGGSLARLSISSADPPAAGPSQQLEFEVLETGHFQNFQWRHLGRIAITGNGTQSLKLEPVQIKKSALLDVRAIHLIPLPR